MTDNDKFAQDAENDSPSSDLRSCFVISPIGTYGSEIRSHMDTVFHCIIEPALSDSYKVIRGDQVARPGRITDQFVDDIITNDLIVCVLTGNNPNVYYELAIAESAARPIIVLRHRDDEIPFDVKDVRFIEYDLDPRRIYDEHYVELVKRAEWELAQTSKLHHKVPFGPHLTPLGRDRFNFSVAERYDLLSPQVSEILSGAKERFYFCGLSLRGWTANEGFIAALAEKAQKIDCHILLMDRDNPAIGQILSLAIESQEDRIKMDIEASAKTLMNQLDPNAKFKLRQVKRGIIYQQMAMSERSMIWVPHLYSRQTGQAPAIRVDLIESQTRESGLEHLYKTMRDEFEQLWTEAGPP